MKILLVASPASTHTAKWAKSLAERGIEVFLFGLGQYNHGTYAGCKNITVYSDQSFTSLSAEDTSVRKLFYLKALPALKKYIRQTMPDIMHGHYASSYGLLGALAGFHPYLVSVWGSDIYIFPRISWLHRASIRYTLGKADGIFSTGKNMAQETSQYTKKPIEVIPFGINLTMFRSFEVASLFNPGDIVIGTIKALEKVYGIDILLRAFAELKKKRPEKPLKLLIVGGGSQERELKNLAQQLGIMPDTVFTGKVPYCEVPAYCNMLSVYVALSNSEGFGVAVLEASACQKPVIVSNVGGLPEVVRDQETGFIVERGDYHQTAEKLCLLLDDHDLKTRMGIAGREYVKSNYDWAANVEKMISVYHRWQKAKDKG